MYVLSDFYLGDGLAFRNVGKHHGIKFEFLGNVAFKYGIDLWVKDGIVFVVALIQGLFICIFVGKSRILGGVGKLYFAAFLYGGLEFYAHVIYFLFLRNGKNEIGVFLNGSINSVLYFVSPGVNVLGLRGDGIGIGNFSALYPLYACRAYAAKRQNQTQGRDYYM